MYELLEFYNQNKKKIIKVILVIALIIGFTQLLNGFVKIKNKRRITNISNNSINKTKTEIISDTSIISGSKLPTSKLEEDTDIIKQFLDFCNNKDVSSAYELLSQDCKDVMFSTQQAFADIYCSELFEERKNYTIENWSGNIYQVKFTGDILSSGNLNSTKQDYITIVKENEENKLNINGYVQNRNVNEKTKYKDVEITVESIDVYMDYEVYNLSVYNDSENTILLDTSDDPKSVYLLDENEMKYYFYNNEIIENKLYIRSKFTNKFQIKFNNVYTTSRNIRKIVFSKFISDYNKYKSLEDISEYNFDMFLVNI